jgi:sec-independent protein translocase protein TatA
MILPMLAFAWPGPFEMLMLAGFGLLIFGKRLPEVGRSIGKTIVEFKKGMREIEQEPDLDPEPRKLEHKFDPYTGKPLDQVEKQGS